jgi:hypothetical protein
MIIWVLVLRCLMTGAKELCGFTLLYFSFSSLHCISGFKRRGFVVASFLGRREYDHV